MMEELDILREWIEIAGMKRRGAPQIAARKTVVLGRKRELEEEVSLLVADDPNMSPATPFRALCPTLMKAVRNLHDSTLDPKDNITVCASKCQPIIGKRHMGKRRWCHRS